MADPPIKTDKLKFDESLQIGFLKQNKNNDLNKHLQQNTSADHEPVKIKRTLNEKIPPFPEFYILAQLADVVYGEESSINALPDGWELFTCAQNKNNGYFGAVFTNINFHQVVISHRGTESTSLKDLWTDLKGIGLNQFVPQMNSAVTFAHWTAQHFRQIDATNQINITGHSLGGWLAQVTTFTLEYLRREEDRFEKINQKESGFHAHTVTFDNPGCKPMLNKLMESFDLRCDSSIAIDSLDISSCLSCPNRFNTYGAHEGTVYRLYPDLKKLKFKEKMFFTIKAHKMENLVESLIQKEGKAVKINKVVDWPHCFSSEYKDFFKWIKNMEFENYDPGDENAAFNDDGISIRYRTKPYDKNSCSLNVFNLKEREFLQKWKKLKNPKKFLEKIHDFENEVVLQDYYELTQNSKIDEKKMKSEELERIIAITKQVIAFSSEALCILRECLQAEEIIPIDLKSQEYIKGIDKLIKNEVLFQDFLGLKDAVQKDKFRLHIIAKNTAFETSRIKNILTQIDVIEMSRTRFLAWKDVLHLQTLLDFNKILSNNSQVIELIIVECPELITDEESMKTLQLLCRSDLKKIIIVSNSENIGRMDVTEMIKIDVRLKEIEFAQLEQQAKEKLLQTKFLNLAGQDITLGTFLGVNQDNETNKIPMEEINQLIPPQLILDLVSENFKKIKVKEQFDDRDLQVGCTEVYTIVTTKHLQDLLATENLTMNAVKKPRILFFTGVHSETENNEDKLIDTLTTREEERQRVRKFIDSRRIIISENKNVEQHFYKICREYFFHKIFWFHLKEQQIYCLKIFDSRLYIRRSFLFGNHTINKRTITQKMFNSNDMFILGNVQNKQQLSKIINVESKVFNNSNVIVTEEDGADIFKRRKTEKAVHWLKLDQNELVWQNSCGSLETLREHIVSEKQVPIDEFNFLNALKKVTIISDKPGMGKSTTLAKFYTKRLSSWVIRINFRNCGEELKQLPPRINLESAVEFLKQKQKWSKDERIEQVFRMCLQYNTFINVFLLFDSYDELSDETSKSLSDAILYYHAPQKALELLKFFKQKTKAHICVTTREYKSQILEDTLSVFSTRFQEIDEQEQEQFLNWKWSSSLEIRGQEFGNEESKKLSLYVKQILKKSQEHFGEEILRLMGIPLQMTMIAEIERPNVDLLKSNTDQEFKRPIENVSSLYSSFVNKKWEIFMEKKGIISKASAINSPSNQGAIQLHQELALKHFFSTEAEHLIKTDITETDQKGIQMRTELNQIGLLKVMENGEYEFVHETFAEYFTASFFFDWLNQLKYQEKSPDLPYCLLVRILLERKYQEIRLFLNDFLTENIISNYSLEFHGKRIGKLFQENRDIFYNENAETCLHIIVAEQYEKLFHYLINVLGGTLREINRPELLTSFLNSESLSGMTVLKIAAGQGNIDICSTLLKHNVHVNAKNVSPLHHAAWNGRNDICTLLLRHAADVNAEVNLLEVKEKNSIIPFDISNSSTPLHLAAFKGNSETCATLLRHKANVNAKKMNGRTPLHLSAVNGHEDVCGVLLECEADVNAKEKFGEIPLHYAARSGHKDVCAVLLQNKARVNACRTGGRTPLHFAAVNGYKDVCEVLLEYNPRLNLFEENLLRPLHLAAENGHTDVCALLLKHKAHVNTKEKYGETPLHLAALAGHKDVCAVLLQNGADVNSKKPSNETPLHFAVMRGHKDVCAVLLEHKAEVNVNDKILLHYAASNSHKDMWAFLLQNKADVNAKDKNNAAENDH